MDFLTLAKKRYFIRKLSDRPVEREKSDQLGEFGYLTYPMEYYC